MIEAAGVDGVRRLYVTVPLESQLGAKLYVGIGVDHATAFAETARIAREFVLLLALVCLAAVVIVVGVGELFVNRPARMLTEVTAQLAAGDLTARARLAQGVPGLADLAEAVNRMAVVLDGRQRERDAYETKLRASEDRYRLLFDHNPLPMWVYDVDTLEFLEVNSAAIRQYGYSRREFLDMRLTAIREPEEPGPV